MSKTKKKKQSKTLDELLAEALVPEEELPYPVPGNWVWVKLKMINKKISRNINPKNYGNEIFELYSVPNFELKKPEYISGKEIGSNKQLVRKNEILLCKINPRINRVWIVSDNQGKHKQIASTEWIVVHESNNVFSKYALYLFKSPYFRKFLTSNVSGVGGSLTRAKPKEVELYPIALPCLNEQKRIAQKLEYLLGKIDQAKQLIQEVKDSFEQRRMTILDQAFHGQLGTNDPNEPSLVDTGEIDEKDMITEEQPYSVPGNWVWVNLGSVVEFKGGGTPSKSRSEYWNGNVPWATVKDVKGKYLHETIDSITELGVQNSSTSLAKPGELLLITRMSPGKAIISMIKTAINQDLKIIKPLIKMEIGFIWIFFEVNRQMIESMSTGSTVKGIQIKKLNQLQLSLPPLPEQKRIIQKVEYLFTNLNQEKRLTEQLETQLDTLKQSILNKAFRGELGTNDPSEESALKQLKQTIQSQLETK